MLVNASFLAQPLTGVQRFALEISKRLKKLNPNIVFVAPPYVRQTPYFDELDIQIIDGFGCKNFAKKQIWEQLVLPRYLASLGNPFLINLGNTAPIFYHNQVVTLHDIAFLEHPEFFSFAFSSYYRATVPLMLKNAKHIFTSSEFSKSKIAGKYGYQDKITAIYNAVSHRSTETICEKEKIILCVGSIEPRKNLTRLVEAFKKINTKGYRLLIIGDRSGIYSDVDTDANGKDIYFTGRVSDDELFSYYLKASLFVYPSLYEGFGIPPLEAQASGCPVLVSKIGAHEEVFLDSVVYCDPLCVDDMAFKMDMMLNDSALCGLYIQRGFDNTSRFDWGMSAEKLYKKAVEFE